MKTQRFIDYVLSFDEKNSWKHNGFFDNFHLTRKIRENITVFWQLSFDEKNSWKHYGVFLRKKEIKIVYENQVTLQSTMYCSSP